MGSSIGRRDHLSTRQPHRAGPKAAGAGPKRTPKDPLGIIPKRLDLRAPSRAVFASFRSNPVGLSG